MKNKHYIFCSLLGLLFAVTAQAQNYTIQTIAGITSGGYSGDGGQATAAEINGPYGTYEDGLGNLYISDYDNNRIRMVNTSGIISTIAGTGGGGYNGDGIAASTAEVYLPRGVVGDANGNIYISDFFNDRIRIINTNGIINTYAGNGVGGYSGDGGPATAAELDYPQGVAIDAAGNIYTTEANNATVRKITTTGIITTFAGNHTSGFSGDNGPATAAECSDPNGVAVDIHGNVYFDDEVNNRIRMVNTSGIITTFAGLGGTTYNGDNIAATASNLYQPIGVAVDPLGNVYIGDNLQRLRMVNTSGIIFTIAGNGVGGFYGDGGPATAAEINAPWSVSVDASGNIYLGDWSNNRVRELPSITTAIGQPAVEEASVNVYPNPSKGVFTFQSSVVSCQCSVMVYNMLGEEVYSNSPEYSGPLANSHQLTTIDLSGHPAGIYFYKVIANNNKIIGEGKLIIQKQ